MTKRKSTRETKNMIQTALWLPREMHEQLKEDGGERGLGDEIRRRLQVSFGVEQRRSDELTELLLDLIKQSAAKLSLVASWWADRSAFEVIKLVINDLISQLTTNQLGSEPQPETMTKLQSTYGPDATPETIAQKIASTVLVENAKEQLRLRFADNQKG
jgi:hypothetical protein